MSRRTHTHTHTHTCMYMHMHAHAHARTLHHACILNTCMHSSSFHITPTPNRFSDFARHLPSLSRRDNPDWHCRVGAVLPGRSDQDADASRKPCDCSERSHVALACRGHPRHVLGRCPPHARKARRERNVFLYVFPPA